MLRKSGIVFILLLIAMLSFSCNQNGGGNETTIPLQARQVVESFLEMCNNGHAEEAYKKYVDHYPEGEFVDIGFQYKIVDVTQSDSLKEKYYVYATLWTDDERVLNITFGWLKQSNKIVDIIVTPMQS